MFIRLSSGSFDLSYDNRRRLVSFGDDLSGDIWRRCANMLRHDFKRCRNREVNSELRQRYGPKLRNFGVNNVVDIPTTGASKFRE